MSIKSLADTLGKKQRKAALSLDQKAIEAVRQYRFSPAVNGGEPVRVKMRVEINFQVF